MIDKNAIARRLVIDEGQKASVYQDSRGYWTIGNGFCVDARVGGVLPEPVRAFWLGYLIDYTVSLLVDFPSLAGLDAVRQQLVVCLLFNMGEAHVEQFKIMLLNLTNGSYGAAADALEASEWFREVGVRGPIYVRIMRTGEWE